MMNKIQILTTATRRPEILERTLSSFRKYMFTGKEELIINIDPVGLDHICRSAIIEMCSKYFKVTKYNLPDKASFPKAFKWLWTNFDGGYGFYLEEDWELLRLVNLNQMIGVMNEYQNLAILRLPFKPVDSIAAKNWKYWFPWNGHYFECPKELRLEIGFCGHPSLIRGEFIKNCASLIDTSRNPEKQFHHGNRPLLNEQCKWDFGVFSEQNKPAVVKDIGREWMVKNGYRKKENKSYFVEWEKING